MRYSAQQDQKYEIRTGEANVVPDAQYNPLEVASEVEALERKFASENDNTRRIGEDIERRYNSQITKARTGGLNAQATTQELEQLGKLSAELGKQVMANKLDMDIRRGQDEWDAIADSPVDDPGRALAYAEGEQMLYAAGAATEQASANAELETNDYALARSIRRLSPWAKHAAYMDLGQRMGKGFGPWFTDLKKNNTAIDMGNGDTLTYEQVRGRSAPMYGAWQQAALRQYRAQYQGISPQLYRMTAKESIDNVLQADTAAFNNHQGDLIDQERRVDIKQDFNLFRTTGNLTSGQAWEQVVTKWAPSYGREKTNDLLKAELDKEAESGNMTIAQSEELWNSKLSNGKSFSSEYGYLWGKDGLGALQDTILRGQSEKIARGQQERDNVTKQQIEEVRKLEKELGRSLNAAELKELQDSGKISYPKNEAWKNYFTQTEDYNKERELDALKSFYGQYGFLTAQQVENFTEQELKQAIPNYVPVADGFDSKKYEDSQKGLEGDIAAMFGVSGVPKEQWGSALRDTSRRAWEDWQAKWIEYRAEGMTDEKARDLAKQYVMKKLNDARTASGSADMTDPKVNAYLGQSYHSQFAQENEDVLEAMPVIRDNFDTVSTTILPGAKPYIEAMVKSIKAGTPNVPTYFDRLAQGRKDVTAWELANMQLTAYNDINGTNYQLGMTEDENLRTQIDPRLTRLLTNFPTPASMARAAVGLEPGQENWEPFLALIRSKESQGYGGPDAMNVPGSYTPYNSVQKLGRGLSTMTIGEVIRLQRNGEVFAAGDFQFTNHERTLEESMLAAGLSENDMFDAGNQAKLAIARAKWRMRGVKTLAEGYRALRNEWEGFERVPDYQLKPFVQASMDPNSYWNRPENLRAGVREKVYEVSHPETGAGFTADPTARDSEGRPAVFSREAAASFDQMVQDSGGSVNYRDITSAQRSQPHNTKVGGVEGSNHLSGNAVDIHGPSKSWIKTYGAKYGWYWLDYDGHDGHFDYRPQ